jgi:hypothetical protein
LIKWIKNFKLQIYLKDLLSILIFQISAVKIAQIHQAMEQELSPQALVNSQIAQTLPTSSKMVNLMSSSNTLSKGK